MSQIICLSCYRPFLSDCNMRMYSVMDRTCTVCLAHGAVISIRNLGGYTAGSSTILVLLAWDLLNRELQELCRRSLKSSKQV